MLTEFRRYISSILKGAMEFMKSGFNRAMTFFAFFHSLTKISW